MELSNVQSRFVSGAKFRKWQSRKYTYVCKCKDLWEHADVLIMIINAIAHCWNYLMDIMGVAIQFENYMKIMYSLFGSQNWILVIDLWVLVMGCTIVKMSWLARTKVVV